MDGGPTQCLHATTSWVATARYWWKLCNVWHLDDDHWREHSGRKISRTHIWNIHRWVRAHRKTEMSNSLAFCWDLRSTRSFQPPQECGRRETDNGWHRIVLTPNSAPQCSKPFPSQELLSEDSHNIGSLQIRWVLDTTRRTQRQILMDNRVR